MGDSENEGNPYRLVGHGAAVHGDLDFDVAGGPP